MRAVDYPPSHEFVVVSVHRIDAAPSRVWQYVTDVEATAYTLPAAFTLLGVPRPLRAELSGAGLGARRTACFDNGKCFRQVVTAWEPARHLRFRFNPDPGFRVGYFFDLSRGPFRILEGWYRLEPDGSTATRLSLGTLYYCSLPAVSVFPSIIARVLPAYQRFLLRAIQANCKGGE